MSSLVRSIKRKYNEDQEDESYGFIVFVSSSPESKRGLLPNSITLNDYDIDCVGNQHDLDLNHVNELDLTDNLISDWAEVEKIFDAFPQLHFLNLSNNLLNEQILHDSGFRESSLLTKLALNGNKLDWKCIIETLKKLPSLQELHISTNSLGDIEESVEHGSLSQLYLSCNRLTNFELVYNNIIQQCPRLKFLNLSDCPIDSLCDVSAEQKNSLQVLNISSTKIESWDELEKLNKFPDLTELKIQNIPLLDEFSEFERRMMVIARLPQIQVLNGGDKIAADEKEDAERSFIRYYLDCSENRRPQRFFQLVEVHGLLEPLVNVDLTPEVYVLVKIYYKDDVIEEKISVRQTVKQFKQYLQRIFKVLPKNMKLFYYDQDMSKLTGPEEMKWNNKGLYTYNVRKGDYFVIDRKSGNKPTSQCEKKISVERRVSKNENQEQRRKKKITPSYNQQKYDKCHYSKVFAE